MSKVTLPVYGVKLLVIINLSEELSLFLHSLLLTMLFSTINIDLLTTCSLSMYEAYFHLKEKPFSISPDPRFIYLTAQHQEAFAKVQYAISQRMGVSAPPGRGTTEGPFAGTSPWRLSRSRAGPPPGRAQPTADRRPGGR